MMCKCIVFICFLDCREGDMKEKKIRLRIRMRDSTVVSSFSLSYIIKINKVKTTCLVVKKKAKKQH